MSIDRCEHKTKNPKQSTDIQISCLASLYPYTSFMISEKKNVNGNIGMPPGSNIFKI